MIPNYDRWKLMSPDEEGQAGEDFDEAFDRIRFSMEYELAEAYATLRSFAQELEPWTDYDADDYHVVQAAKDAWKARDKRSKETLAAVERMREGLKKSRNGLEDTR